MAEELIIKITGRDYASDVAKKISKNLADIGKAVKTIDTKKMASGWKQIGAGASQLAGVGKQVGKMGTTLGTQLGKKMASGTAQAMRGVGKQLMRVGVVKDFVSQFKRGIGELGQAGKWIGAKLKGIGQWIGKPIAGAFQKAGQFASKTFGKAFSAVGGIAKKVLSAGPVQNLLQGLGGAAKSLGRILGTITKGVLNVAKGAAQMAAKFVGGIGQMVAGAGKIAGQIVGAFAKMIPGIIGIAGNIVGALGQAFVGIVSGAVALASGIVSAIAGIVTKVVGIAASIAAGVVNAFASIVSKVVGVFTSIVGMAGETLGKIPGVILGIVKKAALGAAGVIAGAFGMIKFAEFGASLATIRKSFEGLTGTSGEVRKALVKDIRAAAQNVLSEAETMAKANKMLLGGMDTNQIKTVMEFASKAAASVGKDATQAIETLSTGLARGSVMMLDDYGILTKGLKGVEEEYDNLHGKGTFKDLV